MNPTQVRANGVLIALLALSGVADAAKARPIANPASARGQAAQIAAHSAALRAKLDALANRRTQSEEHAALASFLRSPLQEPLFHALYNYRVETSPSSVKELHVVGKTKLFFTGDSPAQRPTLMISNPSGTREATSADLRALKVSTVAQLRALLRKQLQRIVKFPGSALPRSDDLLAYRVKLETERAQKYVARMGEHPDVRLLLGHRRYLARQSPLSPRELVLFDEGGDEVMMVLPEQSMNRLAMQQGDAKISARFGDLVRLQLGTEAQVDALLARHLVLVSGIEGLASSPSVVARARKKIEQQHAEWEDLRQWLVRPEWNEHGALLVSLMQRTGRKSVLIAAGETESLVLVEVPNHTPQFRLVSAHGGGRSDSPTLDHLFTLKIADKAAFEAALGKALLTFDPKTL